MVQEKFIKQYENRQKVINPIIKYYKTEKTYDRCNQLVLLFHKWPLSLFFFTASHIHQFLVIFYLKIYFEHKLS